MASGQPSFLKRFLFWKNSIGTSQTYTCTQAQLLLVSHVLVGTPYKKYSSGRVMVSELIKLFF